MTDVAKQLAPEKSSPAWCYALKWHTQSRLMERIYLAGQIIV